MPTDLPPVPADHHPGGALRPLAALLALGLLAAPALAQEPLAEPAETVDEHLELGLSYLAIGDYAAARLEFETVLRLDDLPPGLPAQAELYADVARALLSGDRLSPTFYAVAGGGGYRELESRAGDGGALTAFAALRAGGRLVYRVNATSTMNLDLDYRFRRYDDAGRRDDSDLRWDANLARTAGIANLVIGFRGRASDRGNGQIRNDYGVYGETRLLPDENDQFTFGVEARRRDYPSGPLRDRSRTTLEVSGGWSHALFGGKASFSLIAGGGVEIATAGGPDGDSLFFNISPSLYVGFSRTLSAFAYAWWQNGRYSLDRSRGDDSEDAPFPGTNARNDRLWEIGGGLSWEFRPGWSLNPELLFLHDISTIEGENYRSMEMQMTLRKDF